MCSIKGLSLPEGTQVRMTCDYGGFTKGQIVTRSYTKRDDSDITVYFVDYNTDDGNHLSDYQWELIEESKEKLPTQGEYIQVRDESDKAWFDEQFVAFYEGRAITTPGGDEFVTWKEWRFPEEPEEVTLKNGKTYIVEERDGEKILILKK